MAKFTFLLITVCASLALDLSAGQALPEGFWQSFAPGQLLQLLERAATPLTYNDPAQRRSDGTSTVAEWPKAPVDSVPATTNSVRKRSDTSRVEANKLKDQVNTPSSDEINYDEAYEAFVRKYFNDKLEEDGDSSELDAGTYKQDSDERSDSDEQKFDTDTENHKSSMEWEPLTEETKTRTQNKSKEKCRRVRKNKQNCMICENARNGEKSESCSFSRQSEPQSYAFEREKSYKKQRDVEEPTSQSVEETSSEETDAAKTDTSFEIFSKRNTSPKDSSTCIQMVRSGKICYQCVDGEGTTTKCYTPKETNGSEHRREPNHRNGKLNTKSHPAKAKDLKVQKTQQRIYKRTISYSYEKGKNGTGVNETPLDVGQVVDTTTAEVTSSDSPHLKEKIIFKLVKQNETIAE